MLNEPSELTATDAPLTVTVTGLDVTSSVLPDTTRAASFVISSSAGFVRVSVGGIVSIVNVTVLAVAAFPSKSDASIEIVCAPSANAVPGV